MSKSIKNKQFWEQQLEKLKISDLSRSQYCRDYGINYDRFSYWIKKLNAVTATFVPVKVQPPERTTNASLLCTLELRENSLKIHDHSALALILDRLT